MQHGANNLSGLRILVVEDTELIADSICDELQSYGCEIVGPIGRLQQALSAARDETLNGALLDVNLAGEQCFPVADILQERDVPFVFITGYDVQSSIPPRFHGVERLTKPFDLEDLATIVARRFSPR
jgi:DNA-binding response OmpR family regulator